MKGSVTVPSSRSVPRALPVRSGGPEHVEHVVEHLEGEPDAPRERAERVGERTRAALRRERTQAAAASNSARVFSSQRSQVALDAHIRRVGVLALQHLAAGERRAAVRERASCPRSLVARELGEGAREQQIAGRRPPPARPALTATVGRPAA